MKKIITSITVLCFAYSLQAQSIQRNVIGSAGNTTTAGTVVLSSTLGETFTSTLSSANNSITQGFQQGNIIVARVAGSESEGESESVADESFENREILKQSGELSLSIFPNPTTDFVNITSESTDEINLTLIDATGKIIHQLKHNSNQTQIDFTNLNAGTYFIVAQSENGNLRNTFKVIKQH